MYLQLQIFGCTLFVGMILARDEIVVSKNVNMEESDSTENNIEAEGHLELIQMIRQASINASTNNRALKRFRSNYWENWVAPYNISQRFPYYLAGYDDEDRPIWIVEFGRFDIRKIVEEGDDTMKEFEKYVYQGIYRIYRSFVEKSTAGHPVTEFNNIIDFDNFRLTQISHLPTVLFCLRLMNRLNDIYDRHLVRAYFINVNYVAERFVTLLRPVAGAVAERWDVYGTRKDIWVHVLRRQLPQDQLPEMYGGKKSFVPVRVFG